MVDRNDIDALLIGSLYGELSSADEARLKAHLESHPADRTALDGLVLARGAVRASRIFELQAEPPQSISALLLQEAARRAPRAADASEGWFARFRRSFLMHPAMAAAAMLVVVASVASTVYVRKGDHFAEPQLAETASSGAAEQAAGSGGFAAAPAPAATPTAAPSADDRDKAMEGQMQVAAGDAAAVAATAKVARVAADTDGSFRVGLADSKEQAEPQKKADRAPAPEPEKRADKPATARAAGPSSLLEVSTPRPSPKELDDEPLAKNAKGRAQRDFAKPADEAPVVAPAAEPAADAKRGEAAAPRAPLAPPPSAASTGRAWPRRRPSPRAAAGRARSAARRARAVREVKISTSTQTSRGPRISTRG